MKSEERRALVLLGITAILASILAAMEAAVWTKVSKFEDFSFNFPPYLKVPHLTTYLIPVLEYPIGFWVAYAFFVFWYFGEDWLHGRKGTKFRNICHSLAIFCLGFYVIYIIWLIPVAYLALVWIPDSLKTVYFQIAFALLLLLDEQLYELATDSRGLLKRAVLWYTNKFRELIELTKDLVSEAVSWLTEKVRAYRKRRKMGSVSTAEPQLSNL